MRYFGVDLSEFQSGISFKKLKDEKIDFIMLRAGYTGSLNGVIKAKDNSFDNFYKKAKKLNIPVGAYFFSRATSYGKGKDEAKYLYENCLKGKAFEYPIAIDVEDPVYQSKANKKEVTAAIKGFCEYLESKGYYVMIYANSYWFSNKMYLKDLKKYDKWVASWTSANPKRPKHGIWQFGGNSNLIRSSIIDGYTVDQDYSYKDYPSIIKRKGLNGFKGKHNKYFEYKTLDNMNIRSGPGTDYKIKKVKDVNLDKDKLLYKNNNSNAILKKGTIYQVIKIIDNKNEIWAETSYGYICIKINNNTYSKRMN